MLFLVSLVSSDTGDHESVQGQGHLKIIRDSEEKCAACDQKDTLTFLNKIFSFSHRNIKLLGDGLINFPFNRFAVDYFLFSPETILCFTFSGPG